MDTEDTRSAETPEQDGSMRRRSLVALALSPLLGAAAAYAAGGRAPSQEPAGLGDCGALAALSARERFRRRNLHNVELTTHQGRRVRFYDDLVRDRRVVIHMMYINCDGICMPVTHNLVGAQKLLGDRVGRDIFFYSITLKPHEDTPEALREYAAMHGVGPGWTYLTGSAENIEALRVGLGFTYSDPEEDADVANHIGHVRLGVEPAARWGHTLGMAPPEHIVRSIRFEFDSPTVRDVATLSEA